MRKVIISLAPVQAGASIDAGKERETWSSNVPSSLQKARRKSYL